MTCHYLCTLGPRVDHPGYLEYRCIDEHGHALPFPGEHEPTTPTPSSPARGEKPEEGEKA